MSGLKKKKIPQMILMCDHITFSNVYSQELNQMTLNTCGP